MMDELADAPTAIADTEETPVDLQRESYHETQTPFAANVASNERTPFRVVNPDDLRDGDGTLRRALELWSCRNGAVQYNQWQSVFFAMQREHKIVDTEAYPGETQSERQKIISELHKEIQEQNYGPDHLAMALLRQRAEQGAIGGLAPRVV